MFITLVGALCVSGAIALLRGRRSRRGLSDATLNCPHIHAEGHVRALLEARSSRYAGPSHLW